MAKAEKARAESEKYDLISRKQAEQLGEQLKRLKEKNELDTQHMYPLPPSQTIDRSLKCVCFAAHR